MNLYFNKFILSIICLTLLVSCDKKDNLSSALDKSVLITKENKIDLLDSTQSKKKNNIEKELSNINNLQPKSNFINNITPNIERLIAEKNRIPCYKEPKQGSTVLRYIKKYETNTIHKINESGTRIWYLIRSHLITTENFKEYPDCWVEKRNHFKSFPYKQVTQIMKNIDGEYYLLKKQKADQISSKMEACKGNRICESDVLTQFDGDLISSKRFTITLDSIINQPTENNYSFSRIIKVKKLDHNRYQFLVNGDPIGGKKSIPSGTLNKTYGLEIKFYQDHLVFKGKQYYLIRKYQ